MPIPRTRVTMAGMQQPEEATTTVHACVRCGGEAPYDFGDTWLCLECYHVAGSTCAGIGRWQAPADPVC
jgi:hypothetical protein